MTDVFLYGPAANPNDVILRDPLALGGSTFVSTAVLPLGGSIVLTEAVTLVTSKPLPLGGSVTLGVSVGLESNQPLPLGGAITFTIATPAGPPTLVEFGAGGSNFPLRGRRARSAAQAARREELEEIHLRSHARLPLGGYIQLESIRVIPPKPSPVVAGRRLATPQLAISSAEEAFSLATAQVELAAPLPWEDDDDELAVLVATTMFD